MGARRDGHAQRRLLAHAHRQLFGGEGDLPGGLRHRHGAGALHAAHVQRDRGRARLPGGDQAGGVHGGDLRIGGGERRAHVRGRRAAGQPQLALLLHAQRHRADAQHVARPGRGYGGVGVGLRLGLGLRRQRAVRVDGHGFVLRFLSGQGDLPLLLDRGLHDIIVRGRKRLGQRRAGQQRQRQQQRQPSPQVRLHDRVPPLGVESNRFFEKSRTATSACFTGLLATAQRAMARRGR